jgi:hypothetical protein
VGACVHTVLVCLLLSSWHMALQTLPTLVVLCIDQSLGLRIRCDLHHEGRLEHEGQRGIGNLDRLQRRSGTRVKRRGVGTMWCHTAVQTATTRQEAFLLGFVHATNQAHELAHAVAMKVRWTECVFGNSPTSWEDDKVGHSNSRTFRRAGQHCKD